jgi:subtilisin family serine protease
MRPTLPFVFAAGLALVCGPGAAGATRARDQVQVVVHARRLAQHAEHAALTRLALRRRLLPRVGRIGRRLEGADWPTDVVTLHVASSAEAARARRVLLRHPWVSSAGLERRFTYRRPLTSGRRQQRPRRMPRDYVTNSLNASHWWRQGATGHGVRVAIFDTGLNGHHPFASHVVEMVDFTGERTTDDRVGHSTFMTGTIGSHAECAGFAPGAELTIVRVFDSTQRSTTAWFLEGFNFALHRRFDLVNLAVGGPDFRDAPFAAKV